MESPVEHYDQDDLVFEKNALVHSRQTFTLLQQKILALATAQIDRSDEGFKTYQIRIQDLVDIGNTKDVYNRLEKETRDLTERAVTIKDSDGSFEHWSIISHAKHVKGSGVLEIHFDPDIRDMLFQLKGEWSASVAMELASCSSVYSVRIMKMLLSYWRRGEWRVSVKELRRRLALEDKYRGFYNFRKRVLQKAQKDLQKNTQMRFTWEEEKNARGRGKGRKITHIKFDFSWKPNQMNLPIEEAKKKGTFDIYGLRERLKRDAQLEQKQIEKVLKFLKKNEGKREQFKDEFARISDCLQQGVDFDNNVLKKPSSWAWPKIESLIEN